MSGASLLSETGAARSNSSSLRARIAAAAAALLLCQQGQRGFLGDAVILFRVVAVHRVDGVPSHAADGLAGGQHLREVDLDRVDAGNVMHHDADLASVVGNARLPFRLGKRGRKCGECGCACFEPGGESFRSICSICCASQGET